MSTKLSAKSKSAPKKTKNGISITVTKTHVKDTIAGVNAYREGKEKCSQYIFGVYAKVAAKGDIKAFDAFSNKLVERICEDQGFIDQEKRPVYSSISGLFDKGFKEKYPKNIVTNLRNICACTDESMRKEALESPKQMRSMQKAIKKFKETGEAETKSTNEPTAEQVEAKLASKPIEPTPVQEQVRELIMFLNPEQCAAIVRALGKWIDVDAKLEEIKKSKAA